MAARLLELGKERHQQSDVNIHEAATQDPNPIDDPIEQNGDTNAKATEAEEEQEKRPTKRSNKAKKKGTGEQSYNHCYTCAVACTHAVRICIYMHNVALQLPKVVVVARKRQPKRQARKQVRGRKQKSTSQLRSVSSVNSRVKQKPRLKLTRLRMGRMLMSVKKKNQMLRSQLRWKKM